MNATWKPGLQARIEAADRIVRRCPRRVPREAPCAGAPRQPLPHARRREPVVDVHAALAQQGVRRRRDNARAAENRREHRGEGAPALAHARSFDLGLEPDDRQVGIVLDGAADGILERQLSIASPPAPTAVDRKAPSPTCAVAQALGRSARRSPSATALADARWPKSVVTHDCVRSSRSELSDMFIRPPPARGSSAAACGRHGGSRRASAPRACRSTAPRTA